MFTELHTAMSRQSPDAADALWNALHVLSYRLSQQHKGQLQLTQHTRQLAVRPCYVHHQAVQDASLLSTS